MASESQRLQSRTLLSKKLQILVCSSDKPVWKPTTRNHHLDHGSPGERAAWDFDHTRQARIA